MVHFRFHSEHELLKFSQSPFSTVNKQQQKVTKFKKALDILLVLKTAYSLWVIIYQTGNRNTILFLLLPFSFYFIGTCNSGFLNYSSVKYFIVLIIIAKRLIFPVYDYKEDAR